MSFEALKVIPQLIEGLKTLNITTPTPVQKAVIPEILDHKSIIAQSETGTGKTLAFLLPVFQMIDLNINNNQTIILAPSHELAIQIHNEATLLCTKSNLPVKSLLAIGNTSMKRQIEKLKKKPQIIVGSPGRILELIRMKKIKPHTIKNVVIDEADSLLTSEQISKINSIIQITPSERQLLFFSATYSESSKKLIRKICPEVQEIIPESSEVLGKHIQHIYLNITDVRDKFKMLQKLVHALKPEKGIIFAHKNDDVIDLADRLNYHNIPVVELHGQNNKKERKAAMEKFKQGKAKLLVASDMAARGLHIEGISHIINYHFPSSSNNYSHRVGRTGRNGAKGMAVSLVSGPENRLISRFEKELKIIIKQKTVHSGKLIDIS